MNIKLAKQQVESSGLDVKQQIIQTVGSVERAFYNLIADRQNLIIAENSLKNAQDSIQQAIKERQGRQWVNDYLRKPAIFIKSTSSSLLSFLIHY